jgi:hypothetical protein
MATQNRSLRPSADSQETMIRYVRNCTEFLNNNFNIREKLLQIDRQYAREMDLSNKQTRAKLANSAGDPAAIQNITIPVVMPQTESALAFLSNTFLTGYPLFPTVSKPIKAKEALQLETVIGEHAVKFGYVPELLLFLRDGLKYNIAAVEVEWTNKKIYSITNDPSKTLDQGNAVETYTAGNYIKRLSMYNTIMDTRVMNPARMHIEAEFAGYTELLGKVALKQLIADLGAESTMNATRAFESGGASYVNVPASASYYIPDINPQALLDPQQADFNWLNWGGVDVANRIKYSSMYEVTRLYARIIPSEFGLAVSNSNTPQIWKFIVVNRNVLIFAERQTNAHNYLGILFGQPMEDGLGWQTKSFSENAVPMQQAATALHNSAMESQRKKVYDRLLYDPSRINKADIDKASSVARIPVKQQAYGTNLSDAVYAVPYRDEGVASILQFSTQIVEMSNVVTGQNRVQQGQFQKGNKTRHEFEDVMSHSNARMQMMALLLEYRFFQPLKEIIKLNIMQYQLATTLYNRDIKQQVTVNPVDIRQASIEFQLADGVIPVDKIANQEGFTVLMQMAGTNPQLAAEYDLIGAFAYFLQLNGATWINDFHRDPAAQKAYLAQTQNLNSGLPATVGSTDLNGQPTSTAQSLQ